MRAWSWGMLLLASCEGAPEDVPTPLFEEDELIVGELPLDRVPAPAFEMSLSTDNFVAGEFAVLHVSGAPPNTLLRVGYGRLLGDGPCPGVLDGRCLSVASPVRVATFAGYSDAAGEAAIAFRVEPGRAGSSLAMQVAAIGGGGVSFSNPIFRLVGNRGTVVAPDVDSDGDGFTPAEGDCADFAVGYNPLMPDTLGDGRDQNCDNADGIDADGDGFVSEASGGDDCGDADPDVNVIAIEVCNGVDDDCNGETDPPTAVGTSTFYVDGDADGYGDLASPVQACAASAGIVANDDDCDDAAFLVKPGAAESCNGQDDDCDAVADEGLSFSTVYSYTGNHQTWTVPGGITSVQVAVWGAGGAGATSGGNLGRGGGGGFAGGALSVTPGEQLVITVGGGGTGFAGDGAHYGGGGGLGGVFTGSYAHGNALLVAGGGGGALWCNTPDNGAGGGGATGQDGASSCNGDGNFFGRGGSQSAGGARAPSNLSGTAPESGGPLQGGRGGDFRSNTTAAFGGGGAGGVGGGGGGGYYGGGGGGHHGGVTAGRGGGGSGYLHPMRVTGGELVGASGSTAARTNHASYAAGIGAGSVGFGAGGNARVVITATCVP